MFLNLVLKSISILKCILNTKIPLPTYTKYRAFEAFPNVMV